MFLEQIVSIMLDLFLTVKWPLTDVQSKCVGLCPESGGHFVSACDMSDTLKWRNIMYLLF